MHVVLLLFHAHLKQKTVLRLVDALLIRLRTKRLDKLIGILIRLHVDDLGRDSDFF